MVSFQRMHKKCVIPTFSRHAVATNINDLKLFDYVILPVQNLLIFQGWLY